MKKSLIALAVLAASGASFAQVSITGNLTAGFQSSNVPIGSITTTGTIAGTDASTSGFGVDTAEIVFSAKEDLGGGMSIAYKATVNLGEYDAGAKADDQSLTLTTPMGALSLLTYKPGQWVVGTAGSGTWYGLDGRSVAARAKRDGYAFTIPVMAGLAVTAAFTEPAGSTGEGVGNAGQSGQGVYNFGAKYSAGPVVLSGAFLSLSNAGTSDATKDTAIRLGGTYDLGVAKVGAAYEGVKLSGGGTNTETAFALTAPLAANLSIAATYASTALTSTFAPFAGAAGTRNGYQVQAQYNLSKTTYIIGSYGSWTGTTTTPAKAAVAAGFVPSSATGNTAVAAVAAVPAMVNTDTKDSSLMAITLVKDF